MKRILQIVLLFIVLVLASCTKEPIKDTYTFYSMDTFISISFYDVENSKVIADNVEAIYKKYNNVASDFTTGNNTVSVYDLNEIRVSQVSQELKELLEFSLEMYEDTNHYFNPFIGRLSKLWKKALEDEKLLEKKVVEEELAIMNNTSLEINGLEVRIIGDGQIDLGGITKGYATNKAVEYLSSIGCNNYLLNAGLSTLAFGEKAGDRFKVSFSNALKEGSYYSIYIKNASIGTSSIKEQHALIENKYYSHLINPKTGYPADYYETISIIGLNSGVLDAYSTACFCMDFEDLKDFLFSKKIDCLIGNNGKLFYKSLGVDSYA